MLRVFFTSEDIARTRIASGADPLWELVLSMHMLGKPCGDLVQREWRRAASTRLQHSPRARDFDLLVTVNPVHGYFPDFLTPMVGSSDLDTALAAVASTPRDQLERDIALLADKNPRSLLLAELARGKAATLTTLTGMMRAYFDIAVAPIWSEVEATVEADRSRRVRAVLDGGTEALLDSLRPTMRWHAGELQVDYPVDQEMWLDGRGLLLVPSYFCWRYPVTLLDPRLPPVLIYPAERGVSTPIKPGTRRALAALIGQNRAAVLVAICDGCTTTELARRTGLSPAAASQHATVLRNAGLVASHRDRNMVIHILTPLGVAMLNAG